MKNKFAQVKNAPERSMRRDLEIMTYQQNDRPMTDGCEGSQEVYLARIGWKYCLHQCINMWTRQIKKSSHRTEDFLNFGKLLHGYIAVAYIIT